MKRTNRIMSMLLAVIMVVCMLPVSVFAADICSCVDRCDSQHIMNSGCSVCTASGNPADCMGTPILQLNGGVERLSDNKAQIGLSAAVNETVEWKYYYLITANSSENPSAETIIADGKSGIYTDLMYLDITDLAEGEKYIHIVLHQEEQDRTTNVLNLTIPKYEQLTIVPSADGFELESGNTLTVVLGTTVTFTTSESGCGMEYKEGTKVGPELEFVGNEGYVRTATFSEVGTYTIEARIGGKTAECTVVVVEDTHYTITPSAESGSYDASTNTLTIVGGGTVNLTLNVSGSVRFYDNGEFTMTPVNGTADSATEWTTNLPNTNKTYHFYHNLSNLQAECIVIVKKACTLTIDYSATLPDGILVGSGIANKTVVAPKGEVIDLSEYWPDELTYSLGGNTYYFTEFLENATGGETIRSVTISDDLTVYAYWTTEKQITITFDTNGGSLPYEKVREACCNISNMNRDRRPTRSGYDFVGWSLENDGTADDGDIQLTEDCTLYAVWKVNSLSAPTNLRWDTSNGTVAVWDAVDGATNYIVELWKKDIISLHLLSHVVSDTSFDFDLTSLSPGSYYFTVRATCDDIKSKSATSDNIIMTSGGTPILINGSSERVDYIDGTAFIVDRDDIANGSVSDVNMTPITVTTTLTNEQAVELINGWMASWEGYSSVDIYINYTGYIRSQLEDYSLADLEVILSNIKRGLLPNDYIADVVIEKIESKKATDLVIAPGYIDSTSAFKVTTGQGLGVTYSNDAIKDLVASVGTDSNVMVATKFEKAEITRDEARTIVAEWAEIVNTAEGEEQIKNLLTNYSIYELALLQQYTNILILDDSTAQKLYELMRLERDKKKEEAAAKANEEPLATFSVNTYAVTADGTQTYIPVKKSMQYTIPVDTSGIPENATLALYRVNEDGTRTKQEILSVANGVVIAQTSGNSDYVLVYTVNETETPDSPQTGDNSHMWLWVALLFVSGAGLAGTTIYGRKRRTN